MKKLSTSILTILTLAVFFTLPLASLTCFAEAEPTYTQAELDTVLALMKPGYEDMSVEAFNEYISDALFSNDDILASHDKVETAMFMGAQKHDFVMTTLIMSITELAGGINNETEYYLRESIKIEVEDGTIDPEGNKNYTSYLIVPCDILYTIDDMKTLTVGTRDNAFIEYRNSLQQIVDSIPVDEYASPELRSKLLESFNSITQNINGKYDGIRFSIELEETIHKP